MDYQSVYQPPREPPRTPPKVDFGDEPPPVLIWYRIYCGLMALLYVAAAVLGVLLLLYAVEAADSPDEVLELQIQGVAFAVVSLPLIILYVSCLFVRGRAGWIMGIIAIAFGLTSCCTAPAAIPLLIYWLKPETKWYYGI